MPLRHLLAILLAIGCVDSVRAGDVYKCTTSAGTVAYQDRPCAQGDHETAMHVNGTAPSGQAPAADVEVAPLVQATAPAAAPAAQPLSHEPPAMWLCTRPEDGKQYMSSDGAAATRMVPSDEHGMPGQSVGTTFGKGGASMPAPGVRRIAPAKVPQDSTTGAYVAVQDQCEPATKEITCKYLQDQYDQVHEKLRHAFKQDQATLEPRLAELDSQMDGC